MEKVKQIFEEIQSTNSKLEKERIIRTNMNDKSFTDTLKFLLNPYIVTGLSDKKINKKVGTTKSHFRDGFSMMQYLQENNTGTDAIIGDVQGFIETQPYNMKEFYKGLFTKSITLGCAANTVNKIMGKGFVPQMEVQQAYSIDKYKFKDNEWFSLSEKLNGVRGCYVNGKFYSRQGHEYNGLNHIINDIEKLGLSQMFIDGELKRNNIDGISDNENFRLTAGMLSADNSDKSQIIFTVFDFMTSSEFAAGESNNTYQSRMSGLQTIKEKINAMKISNIKIVDILYSGTDKSKIDKYLELMTEQDKEGLMLNRNVPYKCKRHNGILKVKTFYNIDLRVIGVEEGTGRLEGTLGALVVDFKGNSVNVGSGYDDETRKYIWENKDDIIGKIIEVKYKEISKNKDGKESLQFPVFVSIRDDKSEESYE